MATILRGDVEALAKLAIDCGYQLQVEVGPGLLMNFGGETFREGIKRVMNNHARLQ